MQVALINGDSKTSKTAVSEGIRDFATEKLGLYVVLGDAGAHYRRITRGVQNKLGVFTLDCVPPEDEIADAVGVVLSEHLADDPDTDWGDLDDPLINAWVSTRIANRPNVKADASGWYERTAQGALDRGADLLLINGRQPRQVLANWLGKNALVPSVEFWTMCHPRTAAHRMLLARQKKTEVPYTAQDLYAQQKQITMRRNADRKHTEFPMTPPAFPVKFVHYPAELELTAQLAVRESWRTNDDPRIRAAVLPRQIEFDNTHMSKPKMVDAASALVTAAYVLKPQL